MEVIPAIDLMDARVIRLQQGQEDSILEFSQNLDYISIAKKWLEDGARCLHVIDLDRALNRGNNKKIVKDILDLSDVPLQIGGGLRSRQSIDELLQFSNVRVIIGTLAFNDPSIVEDLVQEYGSQRIIVALDYRDDIVLCNGWKNSTNRGLIQSLQDFMDLGIERFLATSTRCDGMMTGPDIESLRRLAKIQGAAISAAGGISSLEDIRDLRRIGIRSAIVGRAIYEGALSLKKSVQVGRGVS